MTISNQFAPDAQGFDAPLHLVPPHAEMIHPLLPDDFFEPAPEDLTVDHPFWHDRAERFEERMTRNAILHGWRIGAMGSVETIYALIQYDALDYETAAQLLSDHALACDGLMSPVELPASVGRAV